MAKSSRMTEDGLSAAVNGQIDDAKSFDRSERANHREWALRFFEGEVDFDPMGKNRSKVVSRDVADMHGLIMPGLMRVFFGSDKIVSYAPKRQHIDPKTGKDDSEERCNQASDLVNYIFLRESDGYRQSRSGMSDGLLIGNGIAKHWWDPTPDKKIEEYTGLSEDEYRQLIAEPNVVQDSIEVQEYPDPDWTPPELPPAQPQMGPPSQGMPGQMPPQLLAGTPPMGMDTSAGPMPPEMPNAAPGADMGALAAMLPALAGMMPPPMKYDCKLERIRSKGRVRFMSVPDEEFLMGRDDIVLDETTKFCGHRQRKTRSDLIKEGYPRSKIDKLPTYETNLTDERQYRDRLASVTRAKATDHATEMVEVVECYVLVDYDGDGIAERRRIVMAGTGGARNMLANEEWGDDLPFSDFVPDPRPHMWRGRGLYEEVGDIQRIKTVGMRGLLDNTYQQLVPQEDVVLGAYANMDEIYEPTFGGVRLRNPNFEASVPRVIPFIGDKVFPLLEYMDAVGEKRTGVSQRSQALDADALQNQSATAVNAAQSAAFSKIEEYARNIAEVGGFKRIFTCLYRLVVKHQDEAKAIKLRGKWVEITPTGWDEDVDVTINTGLGTGSRERDLAMLQGISAAQKEAMMALGGPFNPILNVGHIFDTARKMTEAAGVNSPESYFPDLSQEDIAKIRNEQASKPPPPTPEMLAMQAKLMLAQKTAEFEFQMEQRRAAFQEQQDQAKAARDTQNELLKGQRSAETEKAQAEADMAVQRQKMEYELQTAQMQFEFDRQLKLLEFQLKARSDMRATAQQQMGVMPPPLPPELAGEIDPMAQQIHPELMAAATPEPTPLEHALTALLETGRQQLQAMQQQSEMLAQGLGQLAQSNHALAAAHAAPKSITTPDGRTYTATSGMN